MDVDVLLADGEDGDLYEVHRIWSETVFQPTRGATQRLRGSHEYKLASGEELETVDDKAGKFRTWNKGVLITLRQE